MSARGHRRTVGTAAALVVVVVTPGACTTSSAGRAIRAALVSMGLRLAPEKTRVLALNEGFDFLGRFHVQRHPQKGSSLSYFYSYPSKKSMTSIRRRIKAMTTRLSIYQSPGVGDAP